MNKMGVRLSALARYLYGKYRLYRITKAFRDRYTKIDSRLFVRTLDDGTISTYREKWKSLGAAVEIDTLQLCRNLSGRIDYNIVPENLFAYAIEPCLNPHRELSFFALKNVYEEWFGNVFPRPYFHKIDGVYYDGNFNIFGGAEDLLKNAELAYPLLVKPSKDTHGGVGVRVVSDACELRNSINDYRYLIGQEVIEQDEYLNRIHPRINSVRACLYRTKGGTFAVLNCAIRFGVDGGLDNATAGGIVCHIHPTGKLNEYAVNRFGVKYFKHPNSLIPFSHVSLPQYEELQQVAQGIANRIPLCNLVSLDMCLDRGTGWRCLEINVRAQTIRFAQYAGVGFFGEYTDEVIQRVRTFRRREMGCS